ncbi:unnamed protein product [Mytilus coruscus]|uniref:Uncharacterized protein n=1 Tax=Mytilus coruscus TaxID=42192 RepID=A0A6J8AIP9_MYTCO|nr:unnamed protein product [Mytilus coruscus]
MSKDSTELPKGGGDTYVSDYLEQRSKVSTELPKGGGDTHSSSGQSRQKIKKSGAPFSTVFIEELEDGVFKFTEIKQISMLKGETKKAETKEPTDDNHEVVYEAEAVIETFADDDHKFVGESETVIETFADDNHKVVGEPEAVIENFADDALIRNFPKDEIQVKYKIKNVYAVMVPVMKHYTTSMKLKNLRYPDSDMELNDPPTEGSIKRMKVSIETCEMVYDIDNNSGNNSVTSEQYPVLPKLQYSVGEIELSSEDSEDIDDLIDEDITKRDVKHKELYITGVKKMNLLKWVK